MSNHREKVASSPVLDLLSFKRQQTVFIVLNLLVLAVLLLMHWSLASFWGHPSFWLMATVGWFFWCGSPNYSGFVDCPARSNLQYRLQLPGPRCC